MKKILLRFTLLFINILVFSSAFGQNDKETIALIETNLGNIKVKLYNDTPIHRDNFIKLAKQGHYDNTLFYRVVKNFVIQGGSSDSKGAIKGQHIGYGKPMVIQAEIKNTNYHKKGALCAPRQPDRVNFFKESDISQFYIIHGRKYTEKEIDLMEKQINTPVLNAIKLKHFTPEKKAKLDSLRKLKKVTEFREIAEKIKKDIAFDWAAYPDKLYMSEQKRKDYIDLGGVMNLDKEYTVFGEVIEGLDVVDKIANLNTDKQERPTTDVKIKVRILN